MVVELERPLDAERDRRYLGTLYSVLASSAETGGAYAVILRVARRGFSPPLHVHTREDTGFLVIDGRLTLRVGDREVTLGPNQFHFAPKDVSHWFRVESETARFLEINTPGGFEHFATDVSEPAERFDLPPLGRPLPSREQVAGAADKFGTVTLADDDAGPPTEK